MGSVWRIRPANQLHAGTLDVSQQGGMASDGLRAVESRGLHLG
jgi:hypothetical protein